jgi:hypothetical protein
MKKANKLVKAFKLTGLTESEKIQLDNLDWAKLVYNEFNEIVVENEHCSQFPVDDLSDMELDIFIINMLAPISNLDALKEAYIDIHVERCKMDINNKEQLIEEIDECKDLGEFLMVIKLWSSEDIDIRFKKIFGVDTKYFKNIFVGKE